MADRLIFARRAGAPNLGKNRGVPYSFRAHVERVPVDARGACDAAYVNGSLKELLGRDDYNGHSASSPLTGYFPDSKALLIIDGHFFVEHDAAES